MPFFSSLLRRAVITGVFPLALALALTPALSGCAGQGVVPPTMMLSGGGELSDHPETAVPEEPESSSQKDDTPSFQELPSSEESSQSSSQASSSGESAPLPVSSQAPAPSSQASASSSQTPVSSSQAPVSSSQPEEEPDPEDDPDSDDEDDEDENDWDDEDDGDDEDDPNEDESSGQNSYSGDSGWEDLRVSYGGSTVSDSAVSIVARIVQNEVGSSFPDEAIKAQAVAAYTFVRYHNTTGSVPAVGLSSSVSDKVNRLVREVAGEQISYNGKPILATYCAISAGTTTSAQSVWGSHLPYLVPVESEGDLSASGYRVATSLSASSVQSKLEKSLGIRLDGVDPGDWFDILSYWNSGPYVNKVSIGGIKETTGRVIRESILGLRSAAFDVDYDRGGDKFIFTTYGYGHGVGMSQMGAKYYADQGWDYVDILEHYYSGATVG